MQEGPYAQTTTPSLHQSEMPTLENNLHSYQLAQEMTTACKPTNDEAGNTHETHISSNVSVSSGGEIVRILPSPQANDSINRRKAKELFDKNYKSNQAIKQLAKQIRQANDSTLKSIGEGSAASTMVVLGKRARRDEQELAVPEFTLDNDYQQRTYQVQNSIRNQAALMFGAQNSAPITTLPLMSRSFQNSLINMPLIQNQCTSASQQQAFQLPRIFRKGSGPDTFRHYTGCFSSPKPQENLTDSTTSSSFITPTAAPAGLEPTIRDLRNQIFNRRLLTSQNQGEVSTQLFNREIIPRETQLLNFQYNKQPVEPLINAQLSQQTQIPCLSGTFNNGLLMQRLSETKVEELKQQIITTLPDVLSSTDQGCSLNKLLLDYFIHSEISKQASEQAGTTPVFLGAPKVSEGQLEVTTDEKDSNLGAALDDDSCNGSLDEEEKPLSSKAMPITKCPHPNRKHYAKNMCSSCYRKYGRSHYASKCPHPDRLLYSMGMCQTCYLADYHKRRCKTSKTQH